MPEEFDPQLNRDQLNFGSEPSPQEKAREDARPTVYSDAWKQYKALVKIMTQQGVDADNIAALVTAHPLKTVEDLETINARLWTLARDSGIPDSWLLQQVERLMKRGSLMSWFKTAGPGDLGGGPELEAPLPMKPPMGGPKPPMGGPGGPGGGLGGPAGPGAGPMGPGAGPKPPMPGGLGGKPPMGPGLDGPGKSDLGAPGVEGVKQALEKGDLKGALEQLKKLVGEPGAKHGPNLGGPDKPALPKEPNPSKPSPKPESKGDEKKPEDKSEKKDDKPKEDKKAEGSVSALYECGNCGITLELPQS